MIKASFLVIWDHSIKNCSRIGPIQSGKIILRVFHISTSEKTIVTRAFAVSFMIVSNMFCLKIDVFDIFDLSGINKLQDSLNLL